MRFIFLLFVILPILEMFVLLKIGALLGAFATIALVFATAAIGLALLRRQGPSTMLRARERMASGQVPAKEMVEGMFLAVGGALLLTPGFITDTIGFCCLIPGVRSGIIAFGLRNIKFSRHVARPSSAQNFEKNTIEGEFRRED